MSVSGSSKQCPRCHVLLPAAAPVCSACGWQFASTASGTSPSGAPPSEFIPYGAPTSPESWPLDQPDFMAQGQPVYPPQNQTSYPPPPAPPWPPMTPGLYPLQGATIPAGYAPVPAAPARSRRFKALLLIALAVVLFGGAAGGIFWALRASAPTPPVVDRHGLQSNVPLPDNIAFQYKRTVTQGVLTADEWIWTVSSGEPASIEQFYEKHMPDSGWNHIQTIPGDTLGVIGCQGNQVLIVGISKHLHDSNEQGTPTTTDAPTGGSALGIALTSSPQLRQSYCQAP